MKKIFSSLIFLTGTSVVQAQSVAINTDKSASDASAIVDIKSTSKGLLIPRMTTVQRTAIITPAKGLMVFDIVTNSCWFYNGTAWTPLAGTNYWAANSTGDVYNNTAGFVGIGTTTPAYKFSVQTQTNQVGLSHTDGTVTLASYIGAFQGMLGGWLGTRSNHPLYFFTNNSAQQMTIMPGGNVGTGTINPMDKLQIGTVQGFTNYDLGIGNGTQAMVFQQNSGFSNWQSNTNITLLPTNATGNVGINTVSPNNKLQIGDATGFNGNDVAMGNGTNALGIAQTNTAAQFASTTDFVFLPRFGSSGRVGINTSTPKASLDVEGFTSFNIANAEGAYAYYAIGTNSDFNYVAIYGAIQSSAPAPVSIYAAQRVVGSEFDAFSDARIKNVIGNSNGITDLETINALQVKDYTMKDKVKYGNRLYKKVIAQELEKVYPQVVSKHTDFIPNVYQVTNKITKTDSGYLLSFLTNHKIDSNAKKLQLISETGTQQFDILAIPSDKEVIVDAKNIKGDKLFVYGEEVTDFRTVDYEGLTTLNISATQEISRKLAAQDKTIRQQDKNIRQQNKKIAAMEETIELLKRRSATKTFSN